MNRGLNDHNLDFAIRDALCARPERVPAVDLAQAAMARVRHETAGMPSGWLLRMNRCRRWNLAATVAAAILIVALLWVGLSRLDASGLFTSSQETGYYQDPEADESALAVVADPESEQVVLACVGLVLTLVLVGVGMAISVDDPVWNLRPASAGWEEP